MSMTPSGTLTTRVPINNSFPGQHPQRHTSANARAPSEWTARMNGELLNAYASLTTPSSMPPTRQSNAGASPTQVEATRGPRLPRPQLLQLAESSAHDAGPAPPSLRIARPPTNRPLTTSSSRSNALAIPEEQLALRFESLFASSKGTSHRTFRGAQFIRPSHTGRRPPAPRTAEEKVRGREIEAQNRRVVTSSPTQFMSRSPVRCRTAGEKAVSPPPPPVASFEKLRQVAETVEHQRESGRRGVEEKMRRAAEIDTLELRKKVFPFHEEIEQLILRVCAWHVTLAIAKSRVALEDRVRNVRQLRREQVATNERAWLIVSRSMYPPLRRWVRRIRMRRCLKIFFCSIFVVKLRRGRRHRGAEVIRSFIQTVALDRSRALHRFQHTVRRSIAAVERSFRCRKALRVALDEQWMTMETTILLFQFHLLPDALIVPGWKDEVGPLRLKLQHLAPTLPPLEEDESWADVPLYMIRVLKWRNLLHRQRPVGVYEDSINQLPRSLSCFRVPEADRRDCIDELLDAEYRYQRHKFLDARAAAIKKMRNVEEWKDRQAAEIRHDVTRRYPSITPSSHLFTIVCEYELEKRIKAGKSAQNMAFTPQAAASRTAAASSPKGSTGMFRAASHRTRLFNEYELFEKVREALQQQIRKLIVIGQRRKSGIGLTTPPPPGSLQAAAEIDGGGMGSRKATFRQPLVFTESEGI